MVSVKCGPDFIFIFKNLSCYLQLIVELVAV